MTKKILTLLNLFAFITVFSQTGIGTETPEGALEITSPNKDWGLVLPQVDQAENTKNPTGKSVKKGTIVYDLKDNCIKFFNGTEWSGCILAPNFIKLECSTAVLNQDIAANYPIAGGTTVSIPYSNPGEAFNYSDITVLSTNVTGLKAVLSSGSINKKGSGNLVFSISGTPSASGDAKFALDIGGANCEFIIAVKNYTDVKVPTITNLICDKKDQLGHTTLNGKYIINGKEVKVNYSGSLYSSAGSGTYCNTVTMNSCFSLLKGGGNLVITFSRPVTNIGMALGSINLGDELTFSTNNNQPIQLNNSSSCSDEIKINGNKISSSTVRAEGVGANLTIGGVWFTELTIQHNLGSGSSAAASFCLNNSNAL